MLSHFVKPVWIQQRLADRSTPIPVWDELVRQPNDLGQIQSDPMRLSIANTITAGVQTHTEFHDPVIREVNRVFGDQPVEHGRSQAIVHRPHRFCFESMKWKIQIRHCRHGFFIMQQRGRMMTFLRTRPQWHEQRCLSFGERRNVDFRHRCIWLESSNSSCPS